MKKKLMVFMGILFAMCVVGFAGIYTGNQKRQAKQEEKNNVQEDTSATQQNDDYCTLEECRKQIQNVIEKGKNGEYRNLEFAEFTPVVTDEDEAEAITISIPKHEEFTKEYLDEQIGYIKDFYDHDVSLKDIRLNDFDGIDGNELYQQIKEGKCSVKDGDVWWLLYIHDDEYVQLTNNNLWVDTGFPGVVPKESVRLDVCYYAGADDGSLDDTYKTKTGEMTVRQAIEQVEDYFNKNFPMPFEHKFNYRVFKVYILKMDKKNYAFEFDMRKEYRGIPYESAVSGTTAYKLNEVADLMHAVLEGEDQVTFFNGFVYNREIRKDKIIHEIYSPEKAVEKVAERIADQTKYTVEGIELEYVMKRIKGEKAIHACKPVWMILTTNQTDGKETRFYVDVQTGELTSRVMQ